MSDQECGLRYALEAIAELATIYADQMGGGPLVGNICFGFRRIAKTAGDALAPRPATEGHEQDAGQTVTAEPSQP